MAKVTITFDTDDDSLIEDLIIASVENEGITIQYGGGRQAFLDDIIVEYSPRNCEECGYPADDSMHGGGICYRLKNRENPSCL